LIVNGSRFTVVGCRFLVLGLVAAVVHMEVTMQDFRKLRVWDRAQQLCVELYLFSADFPQEERYGITSQLRRAAVSVGSNIAEGSQRKSPKDKARIINVSQSEGAEVMSLLDIVARLGYGKKGTAHEFAEKYANLQRMIEALCQSIRTESAEAAAPTED
jgi:four helix bundle protein